MTSGFHQRIVLDKEHGGNDFCRPGVKLGGEQRGEFPGASGGSSAARDRRNHHGGETKDAIRVRP